VVTSEAMPAVTAGSGGRNSAAAYQCVGAEGAMYKFVRNPGKWQYRLTARAGMD
jgi:hypothetical protein